jgi:hypothetical protein
MTNPPAKYDAAGNSGIINIKTKKTKAMGYNGSLSLTYGQGRYHKLNESFNFNYRKNKVNLFANVGYSNRENFNDLDIQRKFIDPGTKELISHFDQESRIREGGSWEYPATHPTAPSRRQVARGPRALRKESDWKA